MDKRRGFTIVEVLLATVLSAIVLGALASVYSFAARTAANAAASANATRQAQMAGNEIAKTARNSVRCAVITSGGNTGLRCTMPAIGTDTDGDGYYDQYTPIGVNKRGMEKWGTGKRVWYYLADGSGDFAKLGTILWRARRDDDNPPTSGDKDTNWSYYVGGGPQRWTLVESVGFSVDNANRLTTFTLICSQLSRADRIAANADVDAGTGYRTTLSRTVFWRNWHQ